SQIEFFGPISSIYRAKDEEDAIRLANNTPYGLGGSVFSTDIDRAQQVARRIDTGMVFSNQPTGVKADIPFGGVKRSGYGHELIDLGIKEFVNEKVIVVTDIDGDF
ncbi:aldehyde dehydrogenase family protein, partial [Salmonella enterica subsp. enterica serovar Enteritidis]|uniref:aldehyde dehydrogenase family protein n=1 Tax=Salmonella enterica TaxID=28901 RepID=UPI00165CE3FE